MSIPGTHDSGATHSIFDVAGKCQDLDIETQLEIGVRFFDIRLQQVNDKFNVVHSFVDQGLTFDNVLKDLNSFLNNAETHASDILIGAIIGAKISVKMNVEMLRKLFGGFLGLIAIYEIYSLIKEYRKNKKTDNNNG